MIRFSIVLCVIGTAVGNLTSAQTTTLASISSDGVQANLHCFAGVLSADGRFVAFTTGATNLVPFDLTGQTDVFVRDLRLGVTEIVSVDSNGNQNACLSCIGGYAPSMSADGRYVAFDSQEPLNPSDTVAGSWDVYVRDRALGTTAIVSLGFLGAPANGDSRWSSISADGRFVAFLSSATNLVPGDMTPFDDVFVHDRLTGTTQCASVNSAGVPENTSSFARPSISADGRFVTFSSGADNLVSGDTNSTTDVFVRDLQLGTTSLASAGISGAPADSYSSFPSISGDGRFVAFNSQATNLAPNDTNGNPDVFLRDMVTGTTTLVSVDPLGLASNGYSEYPRISADGRFVTFQSDATNLVPDDTDGWLDAFVRDLLVGRTERISLGCSGGELNGASYPSDIAPGGRYVLFTSVASDAVPGDVNGRQDAFVRDRGDVSAFVALCSGDGTGAACPCGNTGSTGHGCDNSAATGGALLTASGGASLSADTVELTSTGEMPAALSIVLQGTAAIAPTSFGGGLRCSGGVLRRLYVKHATAGAVTAPEAGDPSISMRSAALGDTIPLGGTRLYQVWYRDPDLAFCAGGSNVSNAIAIAWTSS